MPPFRQDQPGQLLRVAIFCCALLSACGSGAPSAAAAVDAALPSVTRIAFPHGIDTLPWSPGPSMVVLGDGIVAIPGEFGRNGPAGGTVHLFAAAVESLVSIAPRGEGPGEVSDGGILQARGDTLLILDLGRSALLRYDAAGTYLDQHGLPRTRGILVQVMGDSVDVMALPRPELATLFPAFLWRQPLSGDSTRPLLAASDSFVQALLLKRQGAQIPLAITSERIALAEPWGYTVAVYDNAGRRQYLIDRPMPRPRRDASEFRRAREALLASLLEGGSPQAMTLDRNRLDTLDREFLPHVGQNGLRFDEQGRLWVIGRVADSTFVDVFQDTTLLGRITLPCAKPGRHIALGNGTLALLCAETSNDAIPWRLHLYTIENPTTPGGP